MINFALLPIGQLSEEAQEARNKDLKQFREHHSTKTSRISTHEDLLNRFLISSDPLISSLRKPPQKNSFKLLRDVFTLLKEPPIRASEEAARYGGSEDDSDTMSSEEEDP
jgi:hypothetical protein